ncbi:MAG: phosphoglycerate dehydrogenase [Bacteroidetes bacterium]|nr:phosphoglycerate dehydrogenase [Bacteroidota bacterium]
MNSGIHAVLIADDFHPALTEALEAAGVAFVYEPQAGRSRIVELLGQGFEGLIIRSKTPVDKELLQASSQLRWVGRGGSGTENIDVKTANLLGIDVFNAGAANADSVAEHTLGMLLSLLHNLARADAEVRNRIWKRKENRGTELKGKTVGIIGYGNTGSAVAERLQSFGVNVIVYDKYKQNFGTQQIKEVKLDELQQSSDIVTLHVPLTDETRYMVNQVFIEKCKRPFYLLNLSRGEIVNTMDVLAAMANKRIAGFGADVLENEKLSSFSTAENRWFKALIQSPRTVLSPHIGGWTYESYRKISEVLAHEICRRMS